MRVAIIASEIKGVKKGQTLGQSPIYVQFPLKKSFLKGSPLIRFSLGISEIWEEQKDPTAKLSFLLF